MSWAEREPVRNEPGAGGAGQTMDRLLAIEGLTKRFGAITAVDGVSFTVERGEVLGFLGPNGAGKSTTMRMITGFLPPTAGRVEVCGIDVAQQPDRGAKARSAICPRARPPTAT